MPYKDPEKARQRARERYQEIKKNPERMAKRKEQQKIARRKYARKNRERLNRINRKWYKKTKGENPDKLTKMFTDATKRWRKNHPYDYEKYKQREYKRDRQKKNDITIALGGKCQICGNNDFRVLCGHHINGRIGKDINNGKWYRKPPPLNEIQLLCTNCHIIIHSKLDSRGLPI